MSESLVALAVLSIGVIAWSFACCCHGLEKLARIKYWKKLIEREEEAGEQGEEDDYHFDPDEPQDWWKKTK